MRQQDVFEEAQIPSHLAIVWSQLRSSPLSLGALWFVILLLVVVIAGPWLAPHNPLLQNSDALLVPPLWSEGGMLAHPMGTDDLGRDLLSRLIYGTRYTYGNALMLVGITLVIGGTIGALAALSRGIKASILSHLLDATLAIPSLLLALIIVALIGPGLNNTLWAIGLVLIPQFIHATYSSIRLEWSKEYVTAARLDGASKLQILVWDVFPNISSALVIRIMLALSDAILDIAALGFLGFGAQAPKPEWGAMLSSASELFFTAPWSVMLPGLAILLSMLSVNILGEALNSALKIESTY